MSKTILTIQRAFDGFILAKQAEGKSQATVEWYEYNLRTFKTWLARVPHDDALPAITAEHIREFLTYRRDSHVTFSTHKFARTRQKQGCAQRSVRGAFATLSAFFNWALQEGLIERSPAANIKRPKVAKTIVPVFTRDEMQALLKACDESDEESITARNKAMLMVMLDTGVRLAELLDLHIDRINMNESWAQVTGKGAKDRRVYVGAQTKKLLWRYISLFRSQAMGGITNVFLNQDGTAVKPRRFAFILSNLAHKAGITDVHPHRFRHTAAVQFLRNGGNLFALQKMLGHTTLELVRYYVKLTQDDVKNMHKTASPADNWQLK